MSTTSISNTNANTNDDDHNAAIRQHVGKTTASLAIISGLKKRFKNVGFLKPVGQQHERTPGGILVDKVR